MLQRLRREQTVVAAVWNLPRVREVARVGRAKRRVDVHGVRDRHAVAVGGRV